MSSRLRYNNFAELTAVDVNYQNTDLYQVDYQRDNIDRITQKVEVIQGDNHWMKHGDAISD